MNFRSLFALSVIIMLTATSLFSKELDIKALPSHLSSANAGTEFYFSFPPCYEEESAGFMNSCRVFVASSTKQLITIEIPGKGYKVTKLCEANGVVEFVLGTGAAQPFLKSGKDSAPPEQVYQGAAVHVTSQSPVICYGVTRYNYTSDGFLAVPVSAFGTEYIVSSYPQYTAVGSGYQLTSETTISAAYDSTEVSFEMGGNSASQTSGGLKPGSTATFMLKNKGDVLCFSSNGDLQDLSGSYITSSKPVGVVSGNQCANVPAGVYACDYMAEMELPMFTWGTEYHVTPFFGRKVNPIIRIYAKEKNTKVYRDGQEWLVIPRSTRKLDNGYIERRSYDGDPRAVVISADKPIYVEEYNTGQSDDNVPSDPFMLVLSPLQQYQKTIMWCTPGAITSNNNFKKHYVNVIYQLTPDDDIPDDLEFGISVNGQFEYKKLSARFGGSPGLIFSVPVNGQTYACKQLTLPGDNVYILRAKTPFTAYGYGFSNYDSYGMPAGGGLNDLEVTDTLKPNPKWTQECDGSVNNGVVTDFPENSASRSNLGLIYMFPDSSSNYNFTYNTKHDFIAGMTRATDWNLKVTNPNEDARAFLVFRDRSGNDTTIMVEYKPLALAAEPSDFLNFSVMKKNEKQTKNVVIRNTDSTPITINNLELKNKTKGFAIEKIALPLILAPGATQDIIVTFSQDSVGLYSDQLSIASSCITLDKTILKAEIVTPEIRVTDHNYNSREVGTRTRNNFLITNKGKVDLLVTGDDHNTSLIGTPFESKDWPTYPFILKPEQSQSFYVDFAPITYGDFFATIAFSSDGDGIGSDSVAELQGSSFAIDVHELDGNLSGILTKLTPQPATGTATLTVTMPSSQTVTISIINILGQRVGTLAEHIKLEQGEHTFPISTAQYSTGNYSIEIRPSKGEPVIQPMTIVR